MFSLFINSLAWLHDSMVTDEVRSNFIFVITGHFLEINEKLSFKKTGKVSTIISHERNNSAQIEAKKTPVRKTPLGSEQSPNSLPEPGGPKISDCVDLTREFEW